MSKILLVPTDFSNNALTATRYAMQLSRELNARVHLIHVYSAFTSSFQGDLANETDAKRARTGAENGMKDFLEQVEGDIRIEYTIISGNMVEKVIDYAQNNPDVNLVVMGTHGASGARKDVLGSNTYDLAKRSLLPLLVVPEHYTQFKLENLVFFTDYQKGDAATVTKMNDILSADQKKCTLVHITDRDLKEAEEALEKWAQHLKEMTDYQHLSTLIVSDNESASVVEKVIQQQSADLCLLTLLEGRNFFEKLFRKSLAKEVILNPVVPVLLTVHNKEKNN